MRGQRSVTSLIRLSPDTKNCGNRKLPRSLQSLSRSQSNRTSIREIVSEALADQYLSIEAEEALRQLMRGKYGPDDFEAFMALQRAFLSGSLRQESRERLLGQQNFTIAAVADSIAPACTTRDLSYA